MARPVALSHCRHVVAFSGILFTIFASTQATPRPDPPVLPPSSLSLSSGCPTRHLAASVTPLSLSERGLCGFPSGVVVALVFPVFPERFLLVLPLAAFVFLNSGVFFLCLLFLSTIILHLLQASTPPLPPSAIVIKCHWLTSQSQSLLTSRPAFVAAVGAVNQLK